MSANARFSELPQQRTDKYNMTAKETGRGRFYQRPEWWFGGPFLLFGAIILLCGLFRSADELYIRGCGERTEATVCRIHKKYSGGRRGAWVYTPVFRFTDTQGQPHTVTNNYGSSDFDDMKVGMQVAITYLPENPEKLILHHRETGFICFVLISFGGIFTAVGGCIIYLFTRKNASRNEKTAID